MKLALLLWLAAALSGAVLAVPKYSHLQLFLLFVLFAALPPVAYLWRKGHLFAGARTKRKRDSGTRCGEGKGTRQG